jgi:hypothetical protein
MTFAVVFYCSFSVVLTVCHVLFIGIFSHLLSCTAINIVCVIKLFGIRGGGIWLRYGKVRRLFVRERPDREPTALRSAVQGF